MLAADSASPLRSSARSSCKIKALADESLLKLTRGAEYTVDELLRTMITASDNDAVVLLRSVILAEALDAVFRDFGRVIPDVRVLDDSMSVREYAIFLRWPTSSASVRLTAAAPSSYTTAASFIIRPRTACCAS